MRIRLAMRKVYWIAVLAITPAALFSSSCGNLFKKSPEDVVKAFFAAANAGKYSEAEKYLSSSAKMLVVLGGGIKELADEKTRDGTIDRVEILKVEKRGEGAKVYYRIHYKYDKPKDDDMSLIIEEGEWRISG